MHRFWVPCRLLVGVGREEGREFVSFGEGEMRESDETSEKEGGRGRTGSDGFEYDKREGDYTKS